MSKATMQNKIKRIVLAACLALVAMVGMSRTVSADIHPALGIYWSLGSDPTAGAGLQAPLWQLLYRTDTNQVYYKSGTAATAWTALSASATTGITGTLTLNTIPKATAAHTIGDSDITDDGSTIKAIGGKPVAIGDSTFTPGTGLDIRSNGGAGFNIPLETFRYKTGDQAGTNITIGFGNGTIAAPTSTPIGTASIGLVRVYGYDTTNNSAETARIGTIVDQATGAGNVPGQWYLANTDGAGMMRRRFRFDSAGHLGVFVAAVQPALSACGTAPTLSATANDVNGTITEGPSATGCTLTFATSYSATTPTCTPVCSVTSQAGLPFTESSSATALTITNIGVLSSTALDYTCSCTTASVP